VPRLGCDFYRVEARRERDRAPPGHVSRAGDLPGVAVVWPMGVWAVRMPAVVRVKFMGVFLVLFARCQK